MEKQFQKESTLFRHFRINEKYLDKSVFSSVLIVHVLPYRVIKAAPFALTLRHGTPVPSPDEKVGGLGVRLAIPSSKTH